MDLIQKQNKNNNMVRYKSRLLAQRFTQRPGIDFNKTYSSVMSRITSWYLTSFGSSKSSIYDVDGRRNRISLWIIRFEYFHEGF